MWVGVWVGSCENQDGGCDKAGAQLAWQNLGNACQKRTATRFQARERLATTSGSDPDRTAKQK